MHSEVCLRLPCRHAGTMREMWISISGLSQRSREMEHLNIWTFWWWQLLIEMKRGTDEQSCDRTRDISKAEKECVIIVRPAQIAFAVVIRGGAIYYSSSCASRCGRTWSDPIDVIHTREWGAVQVKQRDEFWNEITQNQSCKMRFHWPSDSVVYVRVHHSPKESTPLLTTNKPEQRLVSAS